MDDESNKPNLPVAAAVIRSVNGRFLLVKRPLDKHFGGMWEFPGGKIEKGEYAEETLIREMKEELSIDISPQDVEVMSIIMHEYDDDIQGTQIQNRTEGLVPGTGLSR